MSRKIASILALGTSIVGAAHAGPFDPPDPRVFARAEDQKRARLLTKPCTEDDVARGCYLYNGRSVRKSPCVLYMAANNVESLPTDRCYKMEAPRKHRGLWIDEFEGQRFIPEGTSPVEWPRTDPRTPGWKEQAERARLANIWINAGRVDKRTLRGGGKHYIEFVGRKTLYPGAYGHLGMSGQEIIVDRVISLRDCSASGLCN